MFYLRQEVDFFTQYSHVASASDGYRADRRDYQEISNEAYDLRGEIHCISDPVTGLKEILLQDNSLSQLHRENKF